MLQITKDSSHHMNRLGKRSESRWARSLEACWKDMNHSKDHFGHKTAKEEGMIDMRSSWRWNSLLCFWKRWQWWLGIQSQRLNTRAWVPTLFLPVGWSGASYQMSLGFNFLICKLGIITAFILSDWCGDQVNYDGKCSKTVPGRYEVL